MKLVRYGPKDGERPGIIGPEGEIRDLSKVQRDWCSETLQPDHLEKIRQMNLKALPIVDRSTRLGLPVSGIRKFLAIGLNYTDHATEANLPIPVEPVMFTKAISCLSGPTDDIELPPASKKTDWEVELGIVIAKRASRVAEADALSYIAGYCLLNDVSEREYQFERGGTWDKGKGFDTFGPAGPWLVTTDELTDPQDVDLWLEVNGTRRQTGNTANMIFSVSYIVSYLSQFVTLEPADVIATGTPAGVGFGAKPAPTYLAEGDVVTLGSSRLGMQRQRVVAPERSPNS